MSLLSHDDVIFFKRAKQGVRRIRNRTDFFGQNMKTRSKHSEVKNCLSSKNVNLCLLDSVESIVQGIEILYRKQQVVLK